MAIGQAARSGQYPVAGEFYWVLGTEN